MEKNTDVVYLLYGLIDDLVKDKFNNKNYYLFSYCCFLYFSWV